MVPASIAGIVTYQVGIEPGIAGMASGVAMLPLPLIIRALFALKTSKFREKSREKISSALNHQPTREKLKRIIAEENEKNLLALLELASKPGGLLTYARLAFAEIEAQRGKPVSPCLLQPILRIFDDLSGF